MSTDDTPAGFFEEFEEIYKDRDLEDYWGEEESTLKDVIPLVVNDIADKFELREPLDVGGGGVLSIVFDNNIEERRVLKISRPSPGKVTLLGDLLTAEKQNLLRLSNQNLIRIYGQGEVSRDENDFPYYIMQYVEGPDESGLEADDYLTYEGRTKKEILALFHGVLQAIEYLHYQETVHMDLKPENILVNSNGVPLISDLGFAKHLKIDRQDDEMARIGGTRGYVHPEVQDYLDEMQSDPNRLRGTVSREKLQDRAKKWDLYSLGQTFLELLNEVERKNPKVLDRYEKRYLHLLACRLLDGENEQNTETGELALGIPASAYDDIKYSDITQVRIDFEKLMGLFDLTAQVPELEFAEQNFEQASTISDEPFTDRVQRIINDPYVSRLGGITQLGLLYLVYPSANYSRLEHTLGTFSIVCRYIFSLYNDQHNPLFRQIMDKEDIESVLLASLLEDIGQFPLAFEINEADQDITPEDIQDRILSQSPSGLQTAIDEDWNTSLDRVRSILNADSKRLQGSIKDRILESLINGPLGADKIDHLVRDSNKLGLSYGNSIDTEQLVDCLTIVLWDEGGDTYANLGIHEDGKVPAESVAFAHYALFGTIYWSHEFRGIKTMIHRMVWEGLANRSKTQDANEFRSELREFVVPNGSPRSSVTSHEGFPEDSTEMSQLHQLDLAMLEWLAEYGGETGEHLCELFKTRNLFDRIYVLTYEKTEQTDLWENLTEFYTRPRPFKDKRNLQNVFQDRIIERIEDKRDKDDINYDEFSVIEEEKVADLIDAHDHDQLLFLIDHPPTSRKIEQRVEYLEEDSQKTGIDTMEVESLRGTEIWDALRERFYYSIGKLRVYCHPEYSEIISVLLSRDEINGSLRYAYNQVR